MAETIEDLEANHENGVIDDAANDSSVPLVQYDITSYGADYDVEGLVKRLNRDDIQIPPFQRNYVWNQQEASRFVESLLLGLPVPAVFFSREQESNKLLVIDGQQRLKTLQFFYNGIFNPKAGDKKQQVFRLLRVQPQLEGKTYKDLEEPDKIKLNDSLIHAIIVKQEAPQNDNTSVYHIFDRLNSEGRGLTAQEIRTAVDHGHFIDLIKDLNEYENWRNIYGKKNSRLKDQELILRFLAFNFSSAIYEKPMKEFLNKFSGKHRYANEQFLAEARKVFINTIDAVWKSIGAKAFRPVSGINAAVFDSVMIGLARRINQKAIDDFSKVKQAYDELLGDKEYEKLISQSTSDASNVLSRFKKATEKFSTI